MEVAARLPSFLASHLRIVLGHEHVLTSCEDWSALHETVRNRPVDVAVIDPRATGVVETIEVQALLGRYPTVPVVIYTTLTPETLMATVELAKHGVQHVVLRGFDDEPRRFRDLLERLPAYRLADTVLDGLAGQLGQGPPLLRRAVSRLFDTPHAFRDVSDLALAAGMTRRNLDRWLERLGLASARTLLLGARLTRALYYMRDPGFLLDDVTRKLGYASPRLFARQVRAVTGMTPSALRERMRPEDFTVQLTALLSRRGDGNDDGVQRASARAGGG